MNHHQLPLDAAVNTLISHNRFVLVLLAAQRARDLNNGSPSLITDSKMGSVVRALTELSEGFASVSALYSKVGSRTIARFKPIR